MTFYFRSKKVLFVFFLSQNLRKSLKENSNVLLLSFNRESNELKLVLKLIKIFINYYSIQLSIDLVMKMKNKLIDY